MWLILGLGQEKKDEPGESTRLYCKKEKEKRKRTKEKEKGKKTDICQKDTGTNAKEFPMAKTNLSNKMKSYGIGLKLAE